VQRNDLAMLELAAVMMAKHQTQMRRPIALVFSIWRRHGSVTQCA